MDFADATGIDKKTETEAFELLCYYQYKERGIVSFIVRNMLDLYSAAGLAVPDRSLLEKQVKKHPALKSHGIEGGFEFAPGVVGALDNKYGNLWIDAKLQKRPSKDAAPAGSEVIPEERFCGKRDGFDRLISQVNSTYRNEHYDACASVMRRLLEAALILSFQTNGIENEIRSGSGHLKFEELIRKADESTVLGLSGKGVDIAALSGIGDYSGRGPLYTFSANDINSARIAYRNALEALFSSSKL